ncbi:MAG: hypothetical protein HOY69_38580 [Streptomyces sp.]|nr:hypothetical protein [Streptomyces sp.]
MQQVPAHNYSVVAPASRRTPPGYVLQTLRHSDSYKPSLVLNRAGCWAAEGQLRDIEDTARAAGMLGSTETSTCEICRPTS